MERRVKLKAIVWTPREASGYRALMDMRGISVEDVAAEMGKTRKSVSNFLYGNQGGKAGRVRIRPATLTALDSAITAITDRKGGVYAACGSTASGVIEAARLLTASA